MGIRAQLREISASQFADIKTGGKIETLANVPCIFLDKSWHDLHILFKHMEPPLKYAISGDWQYPSSSPSIETFVEEENADYYLAFASPLLVQEIALALPVLSESALTAIANEAGIIFDDYLRGYLIELKQAYSQAARNKNSLYIAIA